MQCFLSSQKSDVSPIADGETAFYHGTNNGTLEIELKLTRKGNVIEGSYEYAAHRQALVLRGELLTDGALRAVEYTNGKPNGEFHLDGFWTVILNS